MEKGFMAEQETPSARDFTICYEKGGSVTCFSAGCTSTGSCVWVSLHCLVVLSIEAVHWDDEGE